MDPRFQERLRQEAERKTGAKRTTLVEQLTAEWFPEERAFFDDDSQLAGACCGRRAGKTRGEVRDLARDGLTIPGARLLYLNSTRGEAERIAWWGNRNDGIASLVKSLGLNVKLDQGKLSAHFLDTDAWLYLRGADDEAELRKALGGAYHKVYWDEAQKIPPKLEQPIREVFMPALLDFGGKFRLTGSPSRQMNGLFYAVTRPEVAKRAAGWRQFHWNLLANPFWGRAKTIDGKLFVVWGAVDEVVSGPHKPGEMQAAIAGSRWTKGILALQLLYGGPDVAPIDSPLMQREGFGRWVREDSNFVYAVNKVSDDVLLYAPHRARPDGFVDVARALEDLPWDWRGAFFALAVDLGYNDPFALTLSAWHPHDPCWYEVCSWKKSELDSDDQNKAMQAIRACVAIGVIDADAGGIGKQVVKGWSKEWVERYRLPIEEAEKQHKLTAIQTFNNDILRGRAKFRDGGPLIEEMRELQWATIVDGSGRMIEDPTMANDCCDSGLYNHRRSYQFRVQPKDEAPKAGTREAHLREEVIIEQDAMEPDEDGYYH